MENLSGQVVKGYELRERIGAGGFGAVYRASQSTVGREVAIQLPVFASDCSEKWIPLFGPMLEKDRA